MEVVRDSFLDQDTIIGTVFHDRDGDGCQDDVNATNVKLNLQGVDQFLRLEDARFVLANDQSVSGDFDTGIAIMAGLIKVECDKYCNGLLICKISNKYDQARGHTSCQTNRD